MPMAWYWMPWRNGSRTTWTPKVQERFLSLCHLLILSKLSSLLKISFKKNWSARPIINLMWLMKSDSCFCSFLSSGAKIGATSLMETATTKQLQSKICLTGDQALARAWCGLSAKCSALLRSPLGSSTSPSSPSTAKTRTPRYTRSSGTRWPWSRLPTLRATRTAPIGASQDSRTPGTSCSMRTSSFLEWRTSDSENWHAYRGHKRWSPLWLKEVQDEHLAQVPGSIVYIIWEGSDLPKKG